LFMNLFLRDPLTHRLAVPPLPQGGEGRRILCFSAAIMILSALSPLGERGDRKAVGEGVESGTASLSEQSWG
jgi:hypothetical protein